MSQFIWHNAHEMAFNRHSFRQVIPIRELAEAQQEITLGWRWKRQRKKSNK